MEALENFGVNWPFFIAQLVNFAILFFLLKRYLYKPILDMLEKRRAEIEEGLYHAKQMAEDAKKFESEQTALREKAKEESQHIVDNAVLAGERIRDGILKDAAEKAKEIMDAAEIRTEEEKKKMLGEVKGEVLELASAIVEKILSSKMDSENDKKFIQGIMKDK
ncbi:MAG: F0F1 ATP synthase subunit B [Candidatus Paceibacterota bacterium]|jgi:F-type H+-transporting ATPase subunit b|nr:F0F1 ATP synthase subunit B [Candidatus Paceibacterota bacterium]